MEDRTLTERVQRVERILAFAGIGGEEFSGCDQAVTGADPVHMPGMDKSFFAASGGENTQRRYNERLSQRIDQEPPSEQTALEEIVNRVGSAMSNIHRVAQRLEYVGNRTMGILPGGTTSQNADKQREPDGTLETVFRMLDYLDASIETLQQKALRLERI